MLAYLFWHYPRENADLAGYESSLRAFHEAMQNSGMNDLRASTSFRVSGLSWINSGALRSEKSGMVAASHAQWLSKPKGMTYATFDELVNPALKPGSIVWRRMMVLGPAPEFCITGTGPVVLPKPLEPKAVLRNDIRTNPAESSA